MSDLRNTIAQFRDAVSAEALENPAPDLRALLARDQQARLQRLGWVAGAALLVCTALVYLKTPDHSRKARAEADAALMRRVNQELIRPVPRAMAPLMGLGGFDATFPSGEEESGK